MSRYNDLLKEFGYRETQGYGRTPFAISSGIYPNNFHDGRDYTYREAKNNACKVMFDGKVTYVGIGGKYGRDYGNIVEIRISKLNANGSRNTSSNCRGHGKVARVQICRSRFDCSDVRGQERILIIYLHNNRVSTSCSLQVAECVNSIAGILRKQH